MVDPVRLLTPRRAMFVGSYAPVTVRIDPASGIVFDELAFVVRDGPQAGTVSVNRERSFEPKRPRVMLLAGHALGKYEIEVLHAPSNSVVGTARFRVTDVWTNEKRGPNLWFDGVNARQEADRRGTAGQVGRKTPTPCLRLAHAASRSCWWTPARSATPRTPLRCKGIAIVG